MGILQLTGISQTAEREPNDYYATHPKAMYKLLEHETFNKNVWECACGEGNLSNVLKEKGFNVYSTDLIDRGYGDEHFDFITSNIKFDGDIITNPPFKYTNEFILKALESVEEGSKVAMFLKLNFLSGKKRYREIYLKYPPQRIYVFTGRIGCAKNNKPELFKSGAMDYAWFIWKKGKYSPTELKWIE